MRRWPRSIEHGIGTPHVDHGCHAAARMFEQVRGLGVELERRLVVDSVEVEWLHIISVLQRYTEGKSQSCGNAR